MNSEDYVDYSTAKKLKNAGFDWPCLYYYNGEDGPENNCWLSYYGKETNHNSCKLDAPFIYSAPSLATAAKWLRETHKISVEPIFASEWNVIVDEMGTTGKSLSWDIGYDTYETALSAGISQALKIIL